MAKSFQKNKARSLRRAGVSIRNIAKELNVARSSVSLWCRDILLTKKQIRKLAEDNVRGGYVGRMKGAQMQKDRRLAVIQKYKEIGEKEFSKISKRDMFLFGLGIYAGEGYKCRNLAGVVNADENIIRFMMRWFRVICKVESDLFSCQVGINQLHKNRVSEVERHWSYVTGIPLSSFHKTSLKKVKNKKVYENINMHFGTLYLRIRKSSDLQYQILGWLHGVLR